MGERRHLIVRQCDALGKEGHMNAPLVLAAAPCARAVDHDLPSSHGKRKMPAEFVVASFYTSEVSLAEMLDPLVFRQYAKQATGEKYLVVPNLDK